MIAFLTIASFFLGSSSALAISSSVGGPAQRVLQVGRHPPPLEQQLDHVGRDADRLGRVDQRPLDRLLDPVAGVGAEPGADVGVEALDGPEQAEVPLLDQVLQGQALADVAAGDVDDQPEVGPDHPVAGLRRRRRRSGGPASSPRRRSAGPSR